jgi:simple sugar transport system permease protein
VEQIKRFVTDFGLPRVIIALYLLGLFLMSPMVGVSLPGALSDTFIRIGMNGIMVLALVPMIQSGCGLNFGLPLGIIAGLLGATISIEMKDFITQAMSSIGMNPFINVVLQATGREVLVLTKTASFCIFAFAICVAIPIGAIFGLGYGALLNRVKGGEMMIATYVGFSSVMAMSIAWLVLPYRSPEMVWGFSGEGLRTTITVEGFWRHILDDFWAIRIADFKFPTGTIIFFLLVSLLVWAFFRLKIGTAMTAVGSNPIYARASGVNINRMRMISVMISTILGAVGIIVYEQSFGFIQLYDGPLYMAFPAVAAILIGGAGVNKATLPNVFIGVALYQGILTMTPLIFNAVLKLDMSDVIRIIVSNGMILYALTRKVKVMK